VLATIAHRIGGTPGQVIFKWAHAKGFVVVTTTARRSRLEEYLDVVHLRASLLPRSPQPALTSFYFSVADLTPEEVETIDRAGAKGPPAPARACVRALALWWLSRVRVALGTLLVLGAIILLRHLGRRALLCIS
jgi:hypothetical protein